MPGVDIQMATHITEIARPILRALIAQSEVDLDLKVLCADDLRRTRLIDLLWLAIDEKWKWRRAVRGDKRDRNAGRNEVF